MITRRQGDAIFELNRGVAGGLRWGVCLLTNTDVRLLGLGIEHMF